MKSMYSNHVPAAAPETPPDPGTASPGRCRNRFVTGACAMLLTAAMTPPAATAGDAPSWLELLDSKDITCDQTPFGRRLTLGQDVEMINLLYLPEPAFPNPFQEWILPEDPDAPDAPPLELSFASEWTQNNENELAGTTLLRAIRADLDGDGRDEIVLATRVNGGPSDGHLRLGVIRRETHFGAPIQLFSTWDLAATFAQVEIAAGDFSGSQDGRQELAVMVRSINPDQLRVYVLTGDDEGGIDQADNQWSGFWDWSPTSNQIGVTDMATGDMMLNGRDQITIVAESDSTPDLNRRINYHLLEFQSETAPLLPVEPGHTAIASASFDTHIGQVFRHIDGAPQIDGQGIVKLKADAGDVAGDAAAELIVHMEFAPAGGHGGEYSVGQRLHHFRTTRNGDGHILDVELARREGEFPIDYDYSHIVRHMEPNPGTWDVMVANIDDEEKAEIVFAYNLLEGGVDNLHVRAFKADFDLAASFTYYRSGRQIQFTDTSVGGGPGPYQSPVPPETRWNFGDGTTSDQVHPFHEYDSNGTYTVTLSIRQNWNDNLAWSDYPLDITINDNNGNGGGLDSNDYMYQIQKIPAFQGSYTGDGTRRFDMISLAIGDMDRDGSREIMTFARQGNTHETGAGLVRSIWRPDYGSPPPYDLVGRHLFEASSQWQPNSGIQAMIAVAADFDGDSIQGSLGTDCRSVTEMQARQLVWTPPYFERLQGDGSRLATFGESTFGGGSQQQQFGTFTSHDISAYIGVQLGSDAIGVEATAKATAGYFMQSAHGGIVGSENSFALTEGWSQSNGDALLVTEANRFDCYTYDVSQASIGLDPNSSVRICELKIDDQSFVSGQDPQFWDAQFPMSWASGSGGHPPPQWAPLTRDWSNLALFRTVRSNADFLSDAGPEYLTDGKFTSPVESEPMFQPYIEIDLGSVQDISNIRVFPIRHQSAIDLRGFRVYTSRSPMPDSGLPTGPDVREFAPESVHEVTYDRWNIWTRHWDASDPSAEPGDLLPARYIRLQHPDQAHLGLSQIQVFGDVHLDPPFYPDAICDPTAHDGLFKAKIWDASVQRFRDIEVRGDLLWNGTGPSAGASWQQDGNFLEACTNHADLLANHSEDIWSGTAIGGSGTADWNLSEDSTSLIGNTTSFENSVRAGAEFDLTVGAFVAVVAGGAYEFTTGVTEEHQSVSFWGQGLEIGGGIGGFADGSDFEHCRYNTRPYAFKMSERSNTGYEHTLYAVDYVVPEAVGATAWTRANVPDRCLPEGTGDRIFGNGFEPL